MKTIYRGKINCSSQVLVKADEYDFIYIDNVDDCGDSYGDIPIERNEAIEAARAILKHFNEGLE